MTSAPQLLPLTKAEINGILCKIQDFHGKAGKTSVNELGKETFDEDVPSLEDLQ